jgi:putative transposase
MEKVEIHRKMCKRWDDRWEAHFVTFSCFRRQPFFLGRQSPGWLLDSLSAARERGLFELWAYVIMPEHVHLVILPAEGVAIRTILYDVKRPVGMRCIKWVKANSPQFLEKMSIARAGGKTTHRFWQFGGGYDRNLRSAHDVHEKINYCHDNPVVRELVAKAEDWPWSSARAWSEGVDVPIKIDRANVPIIRV